MSDTVLAFYAIAEASRILKDAVEKDKDYTVSTELVGIGGYRIVIEVQGEVAWQAVTKVCGDLS